MMKYATIVNVVIGASSILLNGTPAYSFSSSSSSSSSSSMSRSPIRMSSSDTTTPENNSPTNAGFPNPVDEMTKNTTPKSRLPKKSQAIPFLNRPPVLTGELAGDFGFDPFGLAKNEESLVYFREAEMKHARLAMLAAAGWPLSELLDRKIAEYFDLTPAIDLADRVPSLLNGGLNRISPAFWGFCLGLAAAIDLYGIRRSRYYSSSGSSYVPGDLGFDPLGVYPKTSEGRMRMQLSEIKHGRVAMVAVTGFAIQEAVLTLGVVDETPFFFYPITETLGRFLETHFGQ